MFINLHVLQPYSFANPNHDDTGAPKTATYGGTLRARISSQAQKRAIRLGCEAELDVRTYRATPSSLAPMLAPRLVAASAGALDEEQAWAAAWLAIASFSSSKADLARAYRAYDRHGAGEPPSAEDQHPETLAWFTAAELDRVVAALAAAPDLPRATRRNSRQQARKVVDTALAAIDDGFGPTELTVAAFGRMYADRSGAKVDAAVQVAHALGVAELTHEIDYFAAVDDLSAAGAGHLGFSHFTGGTFYRFMAIDVDALDANCGGVPLEALRVLVSQSALALPSGGQNATANHEPPAAVFAELRPRPLSYASAFETALEPAAPAAAAVAALFEFYRCATAMLLEPAALAVVASRCDTPTGDVTRASLPALVDAICDAAHSGVAR